MGVRLTGRVADCAGDDARRALGEAGLEQAAEQLAPFGLQELFSALWVMRCECRDRSRETR
jgi:hypothetical protein